MTVTVALPFTLTNGTTADATQVMADLNACVTGFTLAASAGANNDITSLNGLLTPITPAQGGTNVYIGGISTGTANAQVIATTTPNTLTLTPGYSVIFGISVSNTGPATLNIHSTGAQPVSRLTPLGALPLVGSEMLAGQLGYVFWDGATWLLLNPATQRGGYGVNANVAIVAGVADIGLATNHFAVVGGGAITSFGSSASIGEPIYKVFFTGVSTIAYNATTLIIPGRANITTAANDWAELLYLGAGAWQITNYTKVNGTAVVNPTPLAGAVGLSLTAVGSTLNIVYAADSAVLIDPAGNVPIYVTAVSGTINTSVGTVTSTADGMDGEATPTSAWAYIYLISNGTTTAGLVSTNATTPAMPSGYTYRVRVGAMRFSAASQLMAQKIFGDKANYFPTAATNTLTFPQVLTQASGAQVWPVTVSLASFVPPTATHATILVGGTTNVVVAVSSSGQTGGNVAAIGTNPSELVISTVESLAQTVEIALNGGTNIFVGASVGGGAVWAIAVVGWKDKVNAH